MELINWTAGVCHFYFIKFEFFYTVLTAQTQGESVTNYYTIKEQH